MRLEKREFDEGREVQVLVVAESKDEEAVMLTLGDPVRDGDDDAWLPLRAGIKVSDGGLGELYLRLHAHQTGRPIPNSEEIQSYLTCARCFHDKPADISPRDWGRFASGFTELGFQVVCVRCNANVMHMDFQGVAHPANTTAPMEG